MKIFWLREHERLRENSKFFQILSLLLLRWLSGALYHGLNYSLLSAALSDQILLILDSKGKGRLMDIIDRTHLWACLEVEHQALNPAEPSRVDALSSNARGLCPTHRNGLDFITLVIRI